MQANTRVENLLYGRIWRLFLGIVAALLTFGTAGTLLADDAVTPAGVASGEAPSDKPPVPGWADVMQVVVSATRGDAQSFATPSLVHVVGMADFRTQRLFRTTTMALEAVPGIMVQKTSHAQGSPYIRGFTGFRNVMLVDGVRLNNSIFRDGPNQYWNLIDPAIIDALEVVKGPASVLYGGDAIGGTVNARLRDPEIYGEGFDWYRQIYLRASTAERSLVGRAEANMMLSPRLGLLLGGTWKDFGDVRGGHSVGRQDKTGYDAYSGDMKLVYRPETDTTWTLAHYYLREDDAWRAHKTIHGLNWKGTTNGTDLERIIDETHTLSYLRYDRRDIGGWIDAVKLTASFQTLEERRWRTKSNRSGDWQGTDVDTYGLDAQFESPSCIGRWTYGLEWYHDRVDSFNKKYNSAGAYTGQAIQGPVADDATYDLVGVYLQDAIPLTDCVELILGGRYTYAQADANDVQDPDTGRKISLTDDWNALVGSARLNWFVDDERRWNVFGGVSQGFRAPNLSDLTRLDTARSNEIETPAPGLSPENFISYEAGVKTLYDDFAAQVGYYYTDIRDMIVRTPTGNVISGDNEVTKRNAGDGYVHGVEMDASYRFAPQWTAFGSFAWMYGEVETYPTSAPTKKAEPIDRLMPPTGRMGIRWDHPRSRLWAEAACKVAGEADRLSTRDKSDTDRIPPGGTPGYVTFDVRGGWSVCDGLDVWAGLENLTDEDYRIHGSGVNEPGLNLKLGLKWRF